MPKYRASKGFVIAMSALCPIVAALYFGLVPELEAMRRPKVPGDLNFPATRPCDDPHRSRKKPTGSASAGFSLDLLESGYENLMSWKHNPWKQNSETFGEHLWKLHGSKDPEDQKRFNELRQRADLLFKKLEKRYPELAAHLRDIPVERNGFL